MSNKIHNAIIKPTYANYHDMNRDLSIAKSIILDFILKHHMTHRLESTNPGSYKLNRCILYGLKFTMKDNDDLSYHICIRTGKIYVS
jgi:hypothetical protein